MVETFVDYALGPHGRYLSELYLQYQFPINTAVVGFVIYKIFSGKRKKTASANIGSAEFNSK
ncbi:hypothetical protein [Jeotgalibacillus soli]|uniref:Uncharacterized protein n=1 Tax=Jeotgalibacillus soli TaxID=889306 RepID=A0A0C2RHI9_9BACL|nr:hypothetical protein [Jeotgalibacillus soli]KIL49635.1 hypothetical protein KP78_11030 [Jeotgalibacillus soli]